MKYRVTMSIRIGQDIEADSPKKAIKQLEHNLERNGNAQMLDYYLATKAHTRRLD